MATCLGKSCSFGLPRVHFVNCSQFMYLVVSLLVLRAGCGIWLYQFLIIAYPFTLDSRQTLLYCRDNALYSFISPSHHFEWQKSTWTAKSNRTEIYCLFRIQSAPFKFGNKSLYMYILGVFTEKSYSKPLERNVVYIPIITLSHMTSHDYIYILGVFTENPYSKPLERNVVYIPIITCTLIQATSHDFKWLQNKPKLSL